MFFAYQGLSKKGVLYMITKDQITSIRILPNDKKTFPTEDDFLFFIKDTLIRRGGYYYFPGSMMNAPSGTLVLFQYSGKIYACAVLLESSKEKVVSEGYEYAGYYHFDSDTVTVFENSIDKESMKLIYPDFDSFNQSKQVVPLECLDLILGIINRDHQNLNNDKTYTENVLNILEGKEREAVVKVRVNQGAFRQRLLERYGKCCLCGVSNQDLLIASHIKPWNVSSPSEKTDVNNGFLMCPNHDALFDHGFISFNNSGKIIVSDKLSLSDRIFTNINESMQIKLTEKNKEYLEYHRKMVLL